MKRLVTTMVILIFSIAFVNAQTFSLTEEESKKIIESEVATSLKNYQLKFLDIVSSAIDKGPTIEKLKDESLLAVETNNTKTLYALLFDNPEEAEKFFVGFKETKLAFLKENGFIAENPEVFPCVSCETSMEDQVIFFFNNFEKIRKAKDSPLDTSKPTCGSYWNQLKLIACTAGCAATTAGLGAVMCGWGCWCGFCSQNSTLATSICST